MNSSSSFSVSQQHSPLPAGFRFRFGSKARGFFSVFLVGVSITAVLAQQTTVSNGGVIVQQYSGPPSPPPQPRPETYESGPSLGPEGARPSSHYPYSYRTGFGSRPLGPFFLPIALPVLGAPASANPLILAFGYPGEFAGEPFFMAYGNLTANNLLSEKRAERIARYQTARLSLLTELREQLNRVRDASTGVRQHDLAALAAEQTPRLLELETEAEKIRHDLTHVELFSTAADDIGNLRSSKDLAAGDFLGQAIAPALRAPELQPMVMPPIGLGGVPSRAPMNGPGDPQPRRESPERDAAMVSLRLILSSAYFRDGFSSEQRSLLEEMALETRRVIEPESDGSGTTSVFFWPAGARIPVPAGLSPEIEAKFEEFQRRKTALKDELRAVLNREEKRVFNVDSTEIYAQLAAAQASRFAELDALADEIRPALAALADAASVEQLPTELAQRVAAIADRKAALQREMFTRLREFRRELPTEHLELIRQNSGLAIAVTTENSRGRTREAVLARLNAFNDEVSSRFKTLATDFDTVRAAIARFQATAPGIKPGVTVDQLAVDFLASYRARELKNSQRDYAAAVLAPGLSPVQRRLLLTAARADFLQVRPPAAP